MKGIDAILEDVARKLLGIETLEARGMDRLDFHEVSVWSLKEALKEAYDLGKKSNK